MRMFLHLHRCYYMILSVSYPLKKGYSIRIYTEGVVILFFVMLWSCMVAIV